jgi:hypothetical protein
MAVGAVGVGVFDESPRRHTSLGCLAVYGAVGAGVFDESPRRHTSLGCLAVYYPFLNEPLFSCCVYHTLV